MNNQWPNVTANFQYYRLKVVDTMLLCIYRFFASPYFFLQYYYADSLCGDVMVFLNGTL